MNSLEIRSATADDVPAIARVVREAYRPYLSRMSRPPAPMTQDYGRVIREADVWVAQLDGELVGVLVVRSRPDHLLLENIAVLPAAQGRGVAARLLRLVEERAVAAGALEVRLYTNAAMAENLAFYPRRGYVETGRAEQDGFARVFFTKRLSAITPPPGTRR